MSENRIAVIEMTICSVMWSIAGVVIKFIECNPFVIAGFRSLFAAATVLIFAICAGKKIIFNKRVFLTALFMCMTFIAFVCANKMTTAANAIILQFTAPIFILVISALFLKQRLVKRDIIATIGTFIGIFLFFIDDIEKGSFIGNIVGVLSGLFMGIMFMCVGSVTFDEKISGTFFAHVFTACVGIPFVLFTENTVDLRSMGLFILLGVVQLGIPYILMCLASDKLKPIAVSLLSVIEPLLNPMWVALFYHEIPGYISLAGAALILVIITVWCVVSNSQNKVLSKE